MNIFPILFTGSYPAEPRPTKYVWSGDKYLLQKDYPWKLGDLPDYPNRWVADDIWANAKDTSKKLPPFLNYAQNGVPVGRYNEVFMSMRGETRESANFASISNTPLTLLHTLDNITYASGEFSITLKGETYLHEQSGQVPGEGREVIAVVDILRLDDPKTGKFVCYLRKYIREDHTCYVTLICANQDGTETTGIESEDFTHNIDPGRFQIFHLGYVNETFWATVLDSDYHPLVEIPSVPVFKLPGSSGLLNLTCLKQISAAYRPATSYINQLIISKDSKGDI